MATKANRNIKVSQATIDQIKKQGMSASLKAASSNNSPEYREALRRMYGDARVAKATASTKPSSSGRYVGSMFVPDKAPTKRASTSYSPAPMSAAAKAKAAAAGAAKQQEQIKLKNYKYQAGQSSSKPKPTPKSPNGTLTPIQLAQQQAYRSQYNYEPSDRNTAAQKAAAAKRKAEAAKRRAAAAAGRASSARTH